MSIILFILIFGVVVISHEFGHMLIAKLNGITVVEFSVGMGPVLCKFHKGGTKYTLRLFPIGGACMFEGEVGYSSDVLSKDGEKTEEAVTEEKEFVANTDLDKTSGSFLDAKVGARIATVLAGPVFNFILAFLLALIIVGGIGSDLPTISQLTEGGAAEAAGLMPGDRIVSLNGKRIHLYREISFFSMLNGGEDIKVVYERDGKEYSTTITPYYDQEAGRYYMGILGGYEYTKMDLGGTLLYSGYEVKYQIDNTIKSLQMLVQGKVKREDVSGPVGMAQAVDTIYNASKPSGVYYIFLNMVSFAILLSANLGVLNLLPLPALDGGRFVFLLIEAIRRKPVPPEKEGIVHFAGFVLLMVLMVFVLFNDLSRIF
ncbi:MAG: RIP metalloprotease RseP [Lachnospiraceae bacterium]|nr:RIP metalloprotease RseP [Lachnospiraceae bacterium]